MKRYPESDHSTLILVESRKVLESATVLGKDCSILLAKMIYAFTFATSYAN